MSWLPGTYPVAVFGVPLDQVADGDDKLRLKQVEPFDGLREDPGPMAPGTVAGDGELELAGVVVERQRRGRVAFLAREVELGPRRPGIRPGHRGAQHGRGQQPQG
jgi:hypothetical protein